jgi:hypothetical protein
MRQPPRAAKWLLAQLAPSASDSLLGDLQEENEAGRSTQWYRRQVLRAITVGTIRGIQAHPIHTMRAVVIGWIVLTAFFYWLFYPVATLDEQLFVRGLVDIRRWWPNGPWFFMVSACIGHFVSGWVVARFHNRYTILLFLITVFVWNLWSFVAMITIGVTNLPDNQIRVWLINLFLLTPLSIVLGGLLAKRSHPSAASQVS